MVTIPRRAILTSEDREMLSMSVMSAISRPIDDVAKSTGLHPEILRHLVRAGVIDGYVAPITGDGQCNIDLAREIATQLAEARQPLAGQPISARSAMKKYGFSSVSLLTRWKSIGWVKVTGQSHRGHDLLDEGDIAFARKLADLIGRVSSGLGVFPAAPRSGRPRKKRP